MTKLIFIRHGETEANYKQLWYGSLDAPLTPRGEQQVAAIAQRMMDFVKEELIHHFYVSPLGRAQSTAAAIGAAIRMKPEILDGLREFDLGEWEGRSLFELQEKEQLWSIWRDDPTFAPPGGESPASFGARALAVGELLAERHSGETVLAVTHGGIICNIMAAWIGSGLHEWAQWEPHNCSLTVLEQDENGWQVRLFNDTTHFTAALLPTEAPPYIEALR